MLQEQNSFFLSHDSQLKSTTFTASNVQSRLKSEKRRGKFSFPARAGRRIPHEINYNILSKR